MISPENRFWPSYADLMTSLFFVMLVFFSLTIIRYRNTLIISEEKNRMLTTIDSTLLSLNRSELFEYNVKLKRFELKHVILFDKNSWEMPSRSIESIVDAGREIKKLVEEIIKKAPAVRLTVIIEGMVAKGENEELKMQKKNQHTIEHLSFNRAHTLDSLWRVRGLIPDSKQCDYLVSGSGLGGTNRYSGKDEYKNKRFLIYVIPIYPSTIKSSGGVQ